MVSSFPLPGKRDHLQPQPLICTFLGDPDLTVLTLTYVFIVLKGYIHPRREKTVGMNINQLQYSNHEAGTRHAMEKQ